MPRKFTPIGLIGLGLLMKRGHCSWPLLLVAAFGSGTGIAAAHRAGFRRREGERTEEGGIEVRFLHLLTLSLALVMLAGCEQKKPESVAPESEKVSLFKEGKGILFSEETKKLFGVEMA